MSRSIIRVGDLHKVFKGGSSSLLNLIAQLSVLFEDLRIEMSGVRAKENSLGAMGTIGDEYRRLYFVRRSLVTLREVRQCLTAIAGNQEFKVSRPSLPAKHCEHFDEACRFLATNDQVLRKFRNEFGAHFDHKAVDGAMARIQPGSIAKLSWTDSTNEADFALQLHFARGILVAAVVSRLEPGTDLQKEMDEVFEVFAGAILHVQKATYALVHAFLWDRFS